MASKERLESETFTLMKAAGFNLLLSVMLLHVSQMLLHSWVIEGFMRPLPSGWSSLVFICRDQGPADLLAIRSVLLC